MITIISGTNRPGSRTLIVANAYREMLISKDVECQILSLTELPDNFAFAELYGHRSQAMTDLLDRYITHVNKFLFVIPEYNGSFPGVLKTFIDAVPPRLFREKKAAMIGVSDGRSGNVRGQEHLTGILHYLKMYVHYSKPKLSGIDQLLNSEHQLSDPKTIDLLNEHAGILTEF